MSKIYTMPCAQTQQSATAVATAAVASLNSDTPTNTVLLLTAGAEGALVTRLWAIPRGTVTASSLVLFISKDSGSTKRLIDSELMSGQTVSTTAAIAETVFSAYSESNPLRLAAGDRLYVGSQVALADGIVFRAGYVDF